MPGFRDDKETYMGVETTAHEPEPMPNGLVTYRAEGGVAVLELSSPPANAYSYEMNRDLDEAILRARMDDDAHVIVLRGAGEKFFSAGADIAMLERVTPS